LTTLLLTIHIIIAFILIVVILIQQSQGGGLSGAFGGMGNTMFGGTGGAPFMIKVTTVLAVLFAITTFLLVFLGTEKRDIAGGGSNTSGSSQFELLPYVNEYTTDVDTLDNNELYNVLDTFSSIEDSALEIVNDSAVDSLNANDTIDNDSMINIDSLAVDSIVNNDSLHNIESLDSDSIVSNDTMISDSID